MDEDHAAPQPDPPGPSGPVLNEPTTASGAPAPRPSRTASWALAGAAVLVLVGAAAVLVPRIGGTAGVPASSPGAPGSATRPPEGRSTSGMTTITLVVTGCEGCTVRTSREYLLATATVEQGRATFALASVLTRNLGFRLEAPDQVGASSSLVALRFAGMQPGQEVTERSARTASSADVCWTGTTQATAVIAVRAHLVAVRRNDGSRGHLVTAYADPALPTVDDPRPWSFATGGTLTRDIACFSD